MRMRSLNPRLMCTPHLLEEHLAMHLFADGLTRGYDFGLVVREGLLHPGKLRERHDKLAAEIDSRELDHGTPLRDFTYDARLDARGKLPPILVQVQALRCSCPRCEKLIKEELDKVLRGR